MILCVTGKMAAGKNVVSSILEKNGFKTIDCDEVVHEILKEKSIQKKIIDEFGKIAENRGIDLKDSDGNLNRRELAKIVFSDKNLLSKQESIVLPEVQKKVFDFTLKNENSVINATVLWKLHDVLQKCDCVIFVDAPIFVRLFRAKKRDNLSIFRILQRFYAQKNLFSKYRFSNADIYKVENIGDFLNLEQKILKILENVKSNVHCEGKNESV